MTTRRIAIAAAAGLALTLAACSGAPETPANAEENAVVEEVVNEEPPVLNEAPVEVPEANVATPAPTVRDDRGDEAQMYDDADAVGMTARVDRSGGGENASATGEAEVR